MRKQIAIQTLRIFHDFMQLQAKTKVVHFRRIKKLLHWILGGMDNQNSLNMTQKGLLFLMRHPHLKNSNADAYLRRLPPSKLFQLHPFQYLCCPFVNEAMSNMLKNVHNEVIGFVKFERRVIRKRHKCGPKSIFYSVQSSSTYSDPSVTPPGYWGSVPKYKLNQGAFISNLFNYLEDFASKHAVNCINIGCWASAQLTFKPFQEWRGFGQDYNPYFSSHYKLVLQKAEQKYRTAIQANAIILRSLFEAFSNEKEQQLY